MINKRPLLLLIILVIFVESIFGVSIREPDIPMPEVVYELPEVMVGEFIITQPISTREISIYANNKFISMDWPPFHASMGGHGYVIKEDDTWFFAPVYGAGLFISSPVKIKLTDTGFSFIDEDGIINKAIRKNVIPEPAPLAKTISIPLRKTKQQYYVINQHGSNRIIDFNEIKMIDEPFFSLYEAFPPLYHELEITGGLINILRSFDVFIEKGATRNNYIGRQCYCLWNGFLETINETTDGIHGTIQFTNGVSYYHIDSGTAVIEMKGDNITISMKCSTEIEAMILEKIPDAQSPMYLVLEF